MSNLKAPNPETASEYEHFGPAFYERVSSDEKILAKAKQINDLINTYLFAYGVRHPLELSPEVQQVVNQQTEVRFDLGVNHG